MRDDYQNAKKIGDKYKASALLKGKEPYLPSLETEIEDISTYKEIHVGIAEIPLDMIVGTRTTGRQNSFAGNFMPLIAEDSEFAMKWSNLYDAQLDEGLRDPVKAYEYKHRFYVQEGNKRRAGRQQKSIGHEIYEGGFHSGRCDPSDAPQDQRTGKYRLL